jgi:hypothetical protein
MGDARISCWSIVFIVMQAAQFLADGWGTCVLSHDDSSGSMRMVQLPQVHSILKLLQHCASI